MLFSLNGKIRARHWMGTNLDLQCIREMIGSQTFVTREHSASDYLEIHTDNKLILVPLGRWVAVYPDGMVTTYSDEQIAEFLTEERYPHA